MGWTYHTIAAQATGTGQSSEFHVVTPYPGHTVSLFPKANLVGTAADLQYKEVTGGWGDCTDDNGKITLSDTRTQEVVTGPGTYRLNFTARTGSVGAQVTDVFDSSS